MIPKSIGWVARDSNNDNAKLASGSFGGSIDMETVERLIKAHFTLAMRPSGSPTFVDRDGRHVRLYLSIDPRMTEEGRRLIAQDAEKRRTAEKELERELDDLLNGLSTEEAIKRLRGDA